MLLDIPQIKGLAVLAVLATLPNVGAAPMRGNGQRRPRDNAPPGSTPVEDSMSALVRRSAAPGDSAGADSLPPTTTSSAAPELDTPRMINDFIDLVQTPEDVKTPEQASDRRLKTVESLMSNILNSQHRKRSMDPDEDSLRMIHDITDLTNAIEHLPPGANPIVRVKKRDLVAFQQRDIIADIVKIFNLVKTEGMRKFKQWMEKIDVKEIILWLTTADIFKDITETLINGLLDNTALGGMVEKLGDCKHTPMRPVSNETTDIPQNGSDEDAAAAETEANGGGDDDKGKSEEGDKQGDKDGGNKDEGNPKQDNAPSATDGASATNSASPAPNQQSPASNKQSTTPTPAPKKPVTNKDTADVDDDDDPAGDDDDTADVDDDDETAGDDDDTADVDDDDDTAGDDDDTADVDDDTADVDDNTDTADDDDADTADVDDQDVDGVVEPTPVRKPKTTQRTGKPKTSTKATAKTTKAKAKPTSEGIEVFRFSYGQQDRDAWQRRDNPPAPSPAPASLKVTQTADAWRATVTAGPSALPHDYKPYDPATFDDLDDDDEVDVTAGSFIDDIFKGAKKFGDDVKKTFTETIPDKAKEVGNDIKETGENIGEKIVEGAEHAVSKVESVGNVAVSAVTSVAITGFNKLKETALKTANDVKNEFKELVKDGERLFNEAIDELKKLANYFKKWFFQKTIGLAFKSLLQGMGEEKKQKRDEVADAGDAEGGEAEGDGTGEAATGDDAANTALQMGVGMVTRGGVMAFTRFMPIRMFTSIVLGIMSSKLGQGLLKALQCEAQRTDLDWLKDGLQYLTGMEPDPNAQKQARDLHMYEVRDIKVDPNAWLVEASTRGLEPTAKLNFL